MPTPIPKFSALAPRNLSVLCAKALLIFCSSSPPHCLCGKLLVKPDPNISPEVVREHGLTPFHRTGFGSVKLMLLQPTTLDDLIAEMDSAALGSEEAVVPVLA